MGLETLKKRLNYYGGDPQSRLINDKKRSLDGALKLSYQNATVKFLDKNYDYTRTFKALLNDDKIKADYDNKILSIKYEDIQLDKERVGKTSEGIIPTGVCPGQVFYWEEGQSYWIIWLQFKEERAYFRAECRRCEKEIEINGHKYPVYYRGPVETTIPTGQKSNISWTVPNYTAVIYVTKNEETLDYFHRFQVLKIDGNPWKVAMQDSEHGDGVIEVHLLEEYKNTIKEEAENWEEEHKEPTPKKKDPQIQGPMVIYPYSKGNEYTIMNVDEQGSWTVDSNKVKMIYDENEPNKIILDVTSSRSGSCNLTYTTINNLQISLPIKIESL